jgi:hypothetical protein
MIRSAKRGCRSTLARATVPGEHQHIEHLQACTTYKNSGQDPLCFRYGEAPSLKGTVIKALDSEVWPLKDPETMEFVTLQTVAFPLGAVVLLVPIRRPPEV